MHLALLLLNLVASLASVGWAIRAVADPRAMSRSIDVSSGERFYAGVYAARGIPFGLAVGIVPLVQSGTVVTCFLAVAAITQFADAGIGAGRANRGMAIGGLVAGLIHAASSIAAR